MYDEIIKLYEEGLEIPEIIVKLNITYKRVKRAIDNYEREQELNKQNN